MDRPRERLGEVGLGKVAGREYVSSVSTIGLRGFLREGARRDLRKGEQGGERAGFDFEENMYVYHTQY